MRLRCVALRVCRRVPAVRDRIRTRSQVLSHSFGVAPNEYEFNQEISNLDGILQTNSYGFSPAPWMFPRSRSKMVFIKRVGWSHSVEFGKLRNGWFGTPGKVPEPSIHLKKKGLGSSIIPRTRFPSNIHTNFFLLTSHPNPKPQQHGRLPLLYAAFFCALNFAHRAFEASAILFLPAADILRLAGAEPVGFVATKTGCDSFRRTAHLFFCAAAIFLRSEADMVRFAFTVPVVFATNVGLDPPCSFAHRAFCASAILRREAAEMIRFGWAVLPDTAALAPFKDSIPAMI